MTNYKKSLTNQTITLKSALIDEDTYYNRHNQNSDAFTKISLICIGILIGMALLAVIRSCDKDPEPIVTRNNCIKCHSKEYKKKQEMVAYFVKAGSKSPEQMAEAVLKTKNPRLLAALHVGGEKNTPHTSMKTGYKNRYSGAWQTSKHWGKITKNTTITEQALIAEFALKAHVDDEKSIIKGLNAYGGESNRVTGNYAYNVLAELTKVP